MKMEDEFPFGAFFRLSFRDEVFVFGGGGLPHSLLMTCSARCVWIPWFSGFGTLFVIRNEDDLEGIGDSARRLKIMCICNIYIYRPWKSKIKQRMVFRMIHVKDSLLPMGKIALVYIYIYIYTHRVSNNLYTQYITISSRVCTKV